MIFENSLSLSMKGIRLHHNQHHQTSTSTSASSFSMSAMIRIHFLLLQFLDACSTRDCMAVLGSFWIIHRRRNHHLPSGNGLFVCWTLSNRTFRYGNIDEIWIECHSIRAGKIDLSDGQAAHNGHLDNKVCLPRISLARYSDHFSQILPNKMLIRFTWISSPQKNVWKCLENIYVIVSKSEFKKVIYVWDNPDVCYSNKHKPKIHNTNKTNAIIVIHATEKSEKWTHSKIEMKRREKCQPSNPRHWHELQSFCWFS